MISKDEFRNAVIEGIKRVKDLSKVELGDDEPFSNIGLDSLDGMDLVLQVESITGIDFGEFDLAAANTVDKFYEQARQRDKP